MKKNQRSIDRRDIMKHREDLAGEHKKWDLIQLLLVISFLIVWILDSFVLGFSILLEGIVPGYLLLILAIPFWILAGYLAKTGMGIIFGETRDPPVVVTKKVFGHTRHPVYLGSLLLYLGLCISSFSAISFAYLVVIFLIYNHFVKFEEKLLINQFGEKYIKYTKKIPRWRILMKRPAL